jgi:hypothetical protein
MYGVKGARPVSDDEAYLLATFYTLRRMALDFCDRRHDNGSARL